MTGPYDHYIEESSVPLGDGNETHIHPWGPGAEDFVVTTVIPDCDDVTVSIHDYPNGDTDYNWNR
jgi:hypothetical protein